MTPSIEDWVPVRYGDWAADRHGWLFGLTGAAWSAVVVAGLPVLAAVGVHRWAVAAAWTPVWVGWMVAVVVPIRGRSATTWVMDGVRRGIGGRLGWTRWQSRAAAGVAVDLDVLDLPGVLARVAVHDGPTRGAWQDRPALIHDTAVDTWAVVARVAHPGIRMTEPGARARLAAGFADLLEGAAAAELAGLIAVQVRTVPDDGARRAAWHDAHVRPDAPPLSRVVAAAADAAIGSAAVTRDVYVTVVVPGRRLAKRVRRDGRGVKGRAAVLYPMMDEITARLLGQVGATAVSWLDGDQLAVAVRTGFAPGDRPGLARAHLVRADVTGLHHSHSVRPGEATGPGGGGGWPAAAAGPGVAPPAAVRHYRHDAWTTTSYTLLLPDKGAVMGALAPVLTPAVAGEARSVTVFYEPLPPGTADRMVGRDAISAGTAAQVKARIGFASRAADRRAASRVDGQDHQLAHGRALVRVAVAAAVTVPDTWDPGDAAARLEASVRSAGFHPLRLDLAQDAGFAAACVPLGIGLPRRRGAR